MSELTARMGFRTLREQIACDCFMVWIDTGNPAVPTETKWDLQPEGLKRTFFKMADAAMKRMKDHQ